MPGSGSTGANCKQEEPARLRFAPAAALAAPGRMAVISPVAILRDARPWQALRPYVPLPKRRRLTLDASARVTWIGRAEPHAGRVSRGGS